MINKLEIQLISPQVGSLDVDQTTEFPLTFGIGDIRDISKRQGTFSKTIKLPGTAKNNQLLNYYFDVNIEAGTFDINKLQKVQVFQNGVSILNDGYLQLIGVRKVQNNSASEELVEYDVVINDSVGNLFNKINNLELTDLEFGEYDHQLNSTNIVSSLDNTWIDGYKYFFQFKDQNPTLYDLQYFKPAIFAKTYFDKIIGGAGFEYEWDTLTASTVQFDKLLIPYNGDKLKIDQDYIDSISVITSKSGDTSYTAFTYVNNFETVERDTLNAWFAGNGEYTNPFILFNGQNITFEIEVTYNLSVTNFDTSTAYVCAPLGSPLGANLLYDPKIRLMKNFVPTYTQSIMSVPNPTGFNVGSTLAAGATIDFGDFTSSIYLSTTNLIENDILSLEAGFTDIAANFPALPEGQQVTTTAAEQAYWKLSCDSDNYAFVRPRLTIKQLNLRIRPNVDFVGYNGLIRMNNIVPTKIKQSDFLKSIFQMYNLYVRVDEDQPNKLIFQHRDDFYDTGAEVDWTYKLAKDKEQTITLLPDLSTKKLLFTYKQDDADEVLKGYKESVKEVYGQLEFTFDSEYVRGTETKELIFSPITMSRNALGNVLPLINNQAPKTNVKIALNPYQYTSFTGITVLDYDLGTLGSSSTTTNSIPLVSHLDADAYPSFDINFGVCDFYPYDTIGTLTNNNLFNLYWRRTANQINTGRMLTAYFNLNEVDINQLKLNQKVWVKDSWWNINQIIDYKAGRNDLTKVELISIDDKLKFTPFISRSPRFIGPADSQYSIVRNFVAQYQQDTNQVIGSQPANIIGENNFVGGGATVVGNNNNATSNSFVLGNDNIVESSTAVVFGNNSYVGPNAGNSFVVGNGISATTTNTLYAQNLFIPSGGTINGLPASAVTNSLGVWVAGSGTESAQLWTTNVASGNYSVAEGGFTTALGNSSHSEGYLTIATGIYSHAEGSLTNALGDSSHAEGDNTVASGATSHAEGSYSKALGDISHAEGYNTTAGPGLVPLTSISAAHAEGFATRAIGGASHAEGDQTVASGSSSHAEGVQTTAIGEVSHAEGFQTTAIGDGSHTEGAYTTAISDNSHAEGYYTTTLGQYSHVQGYDARAFNDGEFAGSGYKQYAVYSQYGTMHGMVPTATAIPVVLELFSNGSQIDGYTLPPNSTMAFTYNVVARNTSTGASRIITGEGLVKLVISTHTLVYGTEINNNGDAGLAGITAVPVINLNTLNLQLTGLAATNINWSARIDYNIISD